MKIILANPRGFCAGVNMAIECLERALDFFGPPVYVYHEIVHNKYVVDRFKGRGTVFVESLDEVPERSPLLYSAHGVSPQIREQARSRRLLAIDATCPLVTKVHLEAIKYAPKATRSFSSATRATTRSSAPWEKHPSRWSSSRPPRTSSG